MTKKELFKKDLEHLFNSDLRHLYFVEKQYGKALTIIVKSTTHPELVECLERQKKQSSENIDRIEKILGDLNIKSRGKRSRGIEGLIEEAKEVINKSEKLTYVVIDVALVAAVLRITHYKIAAYKTLSTYSKLIGNTYAAELLDRSFDEENETGDELIRIIAKRAKPTNVTLA